MPFSQIHFIIIAVSPIYCIRKERTPQIFSERGAVTLNFIFYSMKIYVYEKKGAREERP